MLAALLGAAVLAGAFAAWKWFYAPRFGPPASRSVAEPSLPARRYSDAQLGFAVDYPAGWQVTDPEQLQDTTGQNLTVVEFQSNLYLGGEQALGSYRVHVAVGPTMGRALAETVAHRTSIIVPQVRDQIHSQCCLSVGGEPAIELTGLPWGRWGCRQIVAVHDGREYRLTFYPYNTQSNTPADIAARAAFERFLRTLVFIPVTVAPTPTITPAATPSSGLSS